jgi:hypothetical protein
MNVAPAYWGYGETYEGSNFYWNLTKFMISKFPQPAMGQSRTWIIIQQARSGSSFS